jgi:hypothetical protein
MGNATHLRCLEFSDYALSQINYGYGKAGDQVGIYLSAMTPQMHLRLGVIHNVANGTKLQLEK